MAGGDDVKAQPSSVKFTYDDLVGFPDDGRRHEIIDGEHYVTPSPNTKHQAVSANLLSSIHAYLRRHQIGHVFPAPFDVVEVHFYPQTGVSGKMTSSYLMQDSIADPADLGEARGS